MTNHSDTAAAMRLVGYSGLITCAFGIIAWTAWWGSGGNECRTAAAASQADRDWTLRPIEAGPHVRRVPISVEAPWVEPIILDLLELRP